MLKLLRKNKKGLNRVHYLVSTAGLPNFGDELITRGWIEYLSRCYPDDDVWLDCSNPSHASLLFRDVHPRLHCVNTLWQLVWNATPMMGNAVEAISQVRNWIENGGTPKEDLGIDVLRSAHSIHLLGGGYINSMWRANTLLVHAVSAMRDVVPNVRLYGTGLGLFPLDEDDALLLRESFSCFDYVEARDQESANIGEIRLGQDDAFLALALGLPRQEQFDKGVFVCLQQDVVGREDSMVDVVLECLSQSSIEEKVPLYLIEAVPPDDDWAYGLFEKRWPGEVATIPFTRLWNSGFPVARNSVYVTSRFHIHLVAASFGAKGIALNYPNAYYANKHSSLFALGTGWEGAGLNGASAASKSHQFVDVANQLKMKKLRLAKMLYEQLS